MGDVEPMRESGLMMFARSAMLAASLVVATAPMALAQAQQPPAQQPGGQPAGQQARETSRGEVGIWLWPLLGLAVIGGVVAAASGGGGGGGGGGSSAPAGTN